MDSLDSVDDINDRLEALDWDHYGLKVFSLDDQEWAIAEDYNLAVDAAKSFILDSLFAFKPEFLAQFIPVSAENIQKIQNALYEDANEIFESLLETQGKDDRFVKKAIGVDGLGHFLSPYDSQELSLHEFSSETDIPAHVIAKWLSDEMCAVLDLAIAQEWMFFRIN